MGTLRNIGPISCWDRIEGLCAHSLGVSVQPLTGLWDFYGPGLISLSNLYASQAFNPTGLTRRDLPRWRFASVRHALRLRDMWVKNMRKDTSSMILSIPFDRPRSALRASMPRRKIAGWLQALRDALALRRWSRDRNSRERLPIFRISRVWEDRWIVTRPGALIGHSFSDLTSAVNFVRRECPLSAAVVELYIGDLYVVAFHDPDAPASLFGERLRPAR